MADLADALYARSQAVAGLTALIGTRFTPGKLDQNSTMPACAYQLAGVRVMHTGGEGSALRQARVHIWSFGTTYDSAKDTDAQVYAAFHDWQGTSGGVTVRHSHLEDGRDGERDDATLRHMVLSVLHIWYDQP